MAKYAAYWVELSSWAAGGRQAAGNGAEDTGSEEASWIGRPWTAECEEERAGVMSGSVANESDQAGCGDGSPRSKRRRRRALRVGSGIATVAAAAAAPAASRGETHDTARVAESAKCRQEPTPEESGLPRRELLLRPTVLLSDATDLERMEQQMADVEKMCRRAMREWEEAQRGLTDHSESLRKLVSTLEERINRAEQRLQGIAEKLHIAAVQESVANLNAGASCHAAMMEDLKTRLAS